MFSTIDFPEPDGNHKGFEILRGVFVSVTVSYSRVPGSIPAVGATGFGQLYP